MERKARWLAAAVLVLLLLGAGCSHVGGRTGPAYDFDPSEIGTGRPVFTPSNDGQYWNGTPMDARPRW